MHQMIGLTRGGLRCGQYHPSKPALTDREVDIIRELHEDHGASYSQIMDWWPGVSKSAIAAICQYKRRASTIERWKRLVA